MKNPKALIFDLDNTLFDSERAYEQALNGLGLSQRNSRYLQARAAVKAQLPPRHVSARNRLLYFKALLEIRSGFSPAKVLAMVDRYERGLRVDIDRQWRALNRSQLFSWLSQRFAIVLLSNENTRTQLVKLTAVDPSGRFFRSIVTSEEVGFEKPDRRSFSAALRRLNLPARSCMMIGDDYRNDVQPALALGMRAVLTREFHRSRFAAPSNKNLTIIDRLDDLKAALS